jgi:hypothetical protein
VPVGWKERAVGFKEVPLLAAVVSGWIAPGAMVVVVSPIWWELCGEMLVKRSLHRLLGNDRSYFFTNVSGGCRG